MMRTWSVQAASRGAAVVAFITGGCGGAAVETTAMPTLQDAPERCPKGSWYAVQLLEKVRCDSPNSGFGKPLHGYRATVENLGSVTLLIDAGPRLFVPFQGCADHDANAVVPPGVGRDIVVYAGETEGPVALRVGDAMGFESAVVDLSPSAQEGDVSCSSISLPPPRRVTGLSEPYETPHYRITVTDAKRCDDEPVEGKVLVSYELYVENYSQRQINVASATLVDDRDYRYPQVIAAPNRCEPRLGPVRYVQPGDRVRGYLGGFLVQPSAKGLRLRMSMLGNVAIGGIGRGEIPVGEIPSK